MPAFHVDRTIEIAASTETVFDIVSDFSTWTKWSPWLCIDREAKVTVSDDPRSVGSLYQWAGELVGQGEVEQLRLERPASIKEEIRFLKPFKSRSDVEFQLESVGGNTKITWIMDGRLPWFMFWMKSSMMLFIGMDYERGLKMLKEFVETGAVLSKTDVVGVEMFKAINVIGLRDSSPVDQIGPAMERIFAESMAKLSQSGTPMDASSDASSGAEMVSVYHPCDLKERRFDFTSGLALPSETSVPPGLASCQVPEGKSLHIRHTGSYENLGNAWSGAYQYARYKKLKVLKQDAVEIYRNDPKTTSKDELITDIYLPLK